MHFLDPINKGIKDYDVFDIVYSQLSDKTVTIDSQIVLVNTRNTDRDTLYRMLNRIEAAHPKAVGVDLLLFKRMKPHTDTLLQSVLKHYDNIILGTSLSHFDEITRSFEKEVDCDSFFCNYAHTGYTNFPANQTNTLRYFSGRQRVGNMDAYAFALQTARIYRPQSAEKYLQRRKEIEDIYFTKTQDYFLQFEPEIVLDTTIDLAESMRNKVVMLGYLGVPGKEGPDEDQFFTPFNETYSGHNLPDMYGLVVHSNIVSMILNEQYVRRMPAWLNVFFTFTVAYFNIFFFYRIYSRISLPYPFTTRLLQIAEILIFFFIVAYCFYAFRLKLNVGKILLALALTFDMIKFYKNLVQARFPVLKTIPEYLPVKTKPKPAAPSPKN